MDKQTPPQVDALLETLLDRNVTPETQRAAELVNKSRSTAAYGFKWMLNQQLPQKKMWLHRQRVRVVLLLRENNLAQLTSLLINKGPTTAHAKTSAEAAAIVRQAGKVKLPTGQELLEKLDRSERENAQLRAIVKDASTQRCVETLTVTYEELVQAESRAIDRLRPFLLGGEACTEKTEESVQSVQMHTNKTRDYVANWRAVAATLRGSRWEKFLDADDWPSPTPGPSRAPRTIAAVAKQRSGWRKVHFGNAKQAPILHPILHPSLHRSLHRSLAASTAAPSRGPTAAPPPPAARDGATAAPTTARQRRRGYQRRRAATPRLVGGPSSPRTTRVAAAASPRLLSAGYPRRGRGVAATRLRKLRAAKSTWRSC